MAGEWGDESNLGGANANDGCSMGIKDRAVTYQRQSVFSRRWLAVLLVMACAAPAAAQVTRPVWYPPLSLYGRPVSQPYFDFPTWARYSNCRPAPLAWGYDPFPNYGPCEGSVDCVPPSVACPGDFVAHRPRDWYASATFAPMTIDYPDGFPVARIGPSGPVVLSTEDLRPEFDAAGKFTIGRRIFDCYRLEGTYLGHYNWDDSLIVTNSGLNAAGSTGNLSSFLSGFSDPISLGLDANDSVGLSFRSSLESAEINLRYWVDMPPGPLDVSYLVGARYFSLRENFALLSTSVEPAPGGTTNNLDISTDNDLWGVQIGIEFACLVSTRWWIDVDLKGGMYNNEARQETTFVSNGATSLVTASGDRTAWVGDISILGNWQITPNFHFKIGYQALFVNGVALAQNQTVGPLFTNDPGALENSGDVFYHGPVIGLGWTR